MTIDDLPQVLEIDSTAFDPLWQNSLSLVKLAFESASFATVAMDSTGIIGYQISNPTQYGAHLGRLAVHPNSQRKGVGFALVRNLQAKFSNTHTGRISVNTQDSNNQSLALYQKAGFSVTEDSFPVFQYTF
jgi:ribosomal protein S18 acetylase RimI-like enzyme